MTPTAAFSSFLLIFFAVMVVGCDQPSEQAPDTLVTGGYNQNEMDAATARARTEIATFLEVLANGEADAFFVKAPITDRHGTEHFWINDIAYRDGSFTGRIGNEPGIVKNVAYDQEWTVAQKDISDWMFIRQGRIHGGYTIDPLLGGMDPAEAETLRSQLVR